jgi:hypothetical protein
MEMEKGYALHQPIPLRVAFKVGAIADVEGVVRRRMLKRRSGKQEEMIRTCAVESRVE